MGEVKVILIISGIAMMGATGWALDRVQYLQKRKPEYNVLTLPLGLLMFISVVIVSVGLMI